MSMALHFDFFMTKAKHRKVAIARMEAAVADKRKEEAHAERRLRDTLKTATEELKRLPVAESLAWKGPKDV